MDVSAVAGGSVVFRANANDGYGNKVVLDHGGGRSGMSAAAQFLENKTDIHLRYPGPRDNICFIAHLHDKEEHVEAFPIPDLVRKRGQVRHKRGCCQGRYHEAHFIDIIALRRCDQVVQDRDLLLRELA